MNKQETIKWLNSTREHYGEYHEKADEALVIAIECVEKCERNCLNCKNYTIYELGYYCEERDIYVYPDMRCDEDWVARF